LEKGSKMRGQTTLNEAEVSQFERIAGEWWDENGSFAPLHRLNPVRLDYIKMQVGDVKGKSVLDVGCGGGLITEPLCRLGAKVMGIDAGAENIKAARVHADAMRLKIDYRCILAEDLVREKKQFDVVTALEIIEHVEAPALFVKSLCALCKKDGVIILSTLNRTLKSYLLGIIAAEQILKWVPKDTHQWQKFMKPSEVGALFQNEGCEIVDVRGLIFNPLKNDFALSRDDLDVNYLMTVRKR
jgi:2-polyprenyl-6-hydroxyphenyl methylase/3-demethylubiquinone-9 3-methyltransferase